MDELKFKVDDLVMYANKIGTDEGSVKDFFMKPAKITGFQNGHFYPYRVKLLKEEKEGYFAEKELIYFASTKDELDAMVIKEQITEELYKELLKTIEVK